MNATEHYSCGMDHYNSNRFDDAYREFSRAIELLPDYSDPLTGRGYVYSIQGDFIKAKIDFDHALRLNPSDADAWKGRADARQILGDFKNSISDYDTAIHLNPRDADYFRRRGDSHSAIGNLQNSMEDYRQAIALNPADPIPYYFLASHLSQAGFYGDAVYHYEEALKVDSNLDTFVYADYAWLLSTCPDTQLRNPAKAIQLAITACENSDWCEDQELGVLAAAYAASQDFANAVNYQTKAIHFACDDRLKLQQSRLEGYHLEKPCDYSEGP